MPIIKNTKGRNATILVTGAASNTIQMSDLTVDANVETVQAATVRKIIWSTNGSVTVARAANVIATLFGNGVWDLQEEAVPFDDGAAQSANLVITVNSGGTVYVEVAKQSDYDDGEY